MDKETRDNLFECYSDVKEVLHKLENQVYESEIDFYKTNIPEGRYGEILDIYAKIKALYNKLNDRIIQIARTDS